MSSTPQLIDYQSGKKPAWFARVPTLTLTALAFACVVPALFGAVDLGWRPGGGDAVWVPILIGSPLVAIAVAVVRVTRGTSSRRDLMACLLAITLGAGSLAYLYKEMTQPRIGEVSTRVKCASNLRQIGQAILMYANENHDRCPDTINQLLATQDITAEVFNCPSTNDTPATGPTTQATADDLTTPGHCSYVYLAKGVKLSVCDPNRVMAYEPLANHDGDGANVLFGDGHVEFVSAKEAKPMLAEIAAGHNPPTTRP